MRRTPVAGLALALQLAPALAPTASASPLLTLRHEGGAFAREDRFLPPAPGPAPAPAVRPPAKAPRGVRARAAAADAEPRPTVLGELARLLAAAAIDQPTYDGYRLVYTDALRTRSKLRG
ncbi:MAG TPA: hypothetical protein VGO81_14805, partial [Solirubrobacteraceae bacterium]|nr:hypothetical protein [Solirubrobacteraceae bacterium]